MAITRNNLGQLERDRGRFQQSIEYLTLAAENARRAELTQVLMQCLANLGYVYTLTGQRETALETLDEASSLGIRYGYQNLLCEVLWKRADLLIESEDLEAAEMDAQSAATLANQLQSRDLASEANRALGRAFRTAGKLELAMEHSSLAWEARSGDSNPVVRARFAAEYALALLADEKEKEARTLLEQHVSQVQLHESALVMGAISSALARR